MEVKLDGIKDPKLPKQIAEEMAKRNDVLEVVYFPPAPAKVKGEYRIKLSIVMNLTCSYFILLYDSRVCYLLIFHNQEYFEH